jgi:hypothetical protein
MVHALLVVLVYRLRELNEGVADEEVCNMGCEGFFQP